MPFEYNRRVFHQQAIAAGAASVATTFAHGAVANDRVRVGFIGLGNRGDQVLTSFLALPDVDIVALCDVYEPYLAAARLRVGEKAKTFRDFRELLDQREVDAVVIATPDHWHALQFIAACQAGKDVYVEKPLSLTISEGRRMVDVARETGRITQLGTQRRSSPLIQEAVRLIHSGAIGKVTVAKCYHLANESPLGIGRPADCDPPSGLDWDLWLGPAPQVAFNPNRCLYKFRWFWDYSGGQLTNMGTHYLDVIQWALQQEAPRSVAALGGRFVVEDNREIPDTMEVVWEYDGALVSFSQYNANASPGNLRDTDLEFRGTDGTLFITSSGLEIVPERIRTAEVPAQSPLERKQNRDQGHAQKFARKEFQFSGSGEEGLHARNFIDCVKSRTPTNCPVEIGHRSTSATLLGNISYRVGRRIDWDAKAERCLKDDAANGLLGYEYRTPWRLG